MGRLRDPGGSLLPCPAAPGRGFPGEPHRKGVWPQAPAHQRGALPLLGRGRWWVTWPYCQPRPLGVLPSPPSHQGPESPSEPAYLSDSLGVPLGLGTGGSCSFPRWERRVRQAFMGGCEPGGGVEQSGSRPQCLPHLGVPFHPTWRVVDSRWPWQPPLHPCTSPAQC